MAASLHAPARVSACAWPSSSPASRRAWRPWRRRPRRPTRPRSARPSLRASARLPLVSSRFARLGRFYSCRRHGAASAHGMMQANPWVRWQMCQSFMHATTGNIFTTLAICTPPDFAHLPPSLSLSLSHPSFPIQADSLRARRTKTAVEQIYIYIYIYIHIQ